LLVVDNIKNNCIKSIFAVAKQYKSLYSTLQTRIYSIFSIAEDIFLVINWFNWKRIYLLILVFL